MSVPPKNIPVLDADGLIHPRWLQFLNDLDMMPWAAKAWAYVTVSGGVPTLVDSYNVASITDAGVGVLNINLLRPFSTANYCSVWGMLKTAGGVGSVYETAHAAGSVQGVTVIGGVLADPDSWSWAAFGKQ